MIKINFKRFIRNRMWFGWWYRYRNEYELDSWLRDPRFTRTPVILVRDTYENPHGGGIDPYYDTI